MLISSSAEEMQNFVAARRKRSCAYICFSHWCDLACCYRPDAF